MLYWVLVTCLLHIVDGILHGACPCPDGCFCSKTLESINCEGKQLTSFPSCIPIAVKKLYMSHNHLSSVETSKLGVFPNLEELYLKNNKILRLQQLAFQGFAMPRLRFLRLDNNVILSIDRQAFHNMTALETLYLTNNEIQNIHPLAFFGSALSMKYLNLDSNRLSCIPSLSQLTRLTSLYIQANDIVNATFPDDYRSIRNLQQIGLSNNNLKSLKTNTFAALETSGVRKIELSRNKLSAIAQQTFAPLNSIQSLLLGWNPLTSTALESALVGLEGKQLKSLNIANLTLGGSLPSSTFKILRNTTIISLIMKHNNIAEIPSRAFSELEHLLTLDLSSNRALRSVSDTAFSGLPELTTLLLSDCNLPSVPNNLPSTLKNLYLNGNKIQELPDNTFVTLTALQKLYLGANQIVRLHERAFNGLSNLVTLHLVHNIIGTLPGQIFSSLVRLTSLELNKNNIKSIPLTEPNVLQSLTALTYLNLADNDMGSVPLMLFNKLSSLRSLFLSNNNLGNVMASDQMGELFLGLNKLQTLDISNNQLTIVHDAALRDMKSLVFISLKQNRIKGWGPNLFRLAKKMSKVDMSLNSIALVNSTSVKDFQANMTLNLTANPLACTCDLRWFRDWVNSTKVNIVDVQKYECNSPDNWRGKLFLSFDKTKINCQWYSLPVLISCSVGAAIFMLILIIACYRNRWFIRLRLYRLGRPLRTYQYKGGNYDLLPGRDITYDAYISCADDDYKWVIDQLFPGIDNGSYGNKPFGGDFKLYMEGRDSEPGKSNIANIVDNMEISRMVIVILSKSYLMSARYDFELEHTIESKSRLAIQEYIVVKLEGVRSKDIPNCLHKRVEGRNFISWEDNPDAIKTFQETLKDLLGARK